MSSLAAEHITGQLTLYAHELPKFQRCASHSRELVDQSTNIGLAHEQGRRGVGPSAAAKRHASQCFTGCSHTETSGQPCCSRW